MAGNLRPSASYEIRPRNNETRSENRTCFISKCGMSRILSIDQVRFWHYFLIYLLRNKLFTNGQFFFTTKLYSVIYLDSTACNFFHIFM